MTLPVDPLPILRHRRSAKWRRYPPDVLPLTVAELDFALAPPVAAALRDAVDRSDTGYALAAPALGAALAGFAADRWGWDIDPAAVTAVPDVGVGVVEVLRALARPGDGVVVSPPVYPPFFHWVPEAGARLVEVPLAHTADGWRLDQPLSTLDERRALLGRLLRDRLPAIGYRPPEATYLAWLDCSAYGPDDTARDRFLERGRVALEPGPRFGAAGSGYARLDFGTGAEVLDEATARMARAVGG